MRAFKRDSPKHRLPPSPPEAKNQAFAPNIKKRRKPAPRLGFPAFLV
nr:MAG TPA: hypothetical protein [Caudoviricetes sp.]